VLTKNLAQTAHHLIQILVISLQLDESEG